MTTNQERARSALWGLPYGVISMTNRRVNAIMDAMNERGLIAPDLPEPTEEFHADIWEWRPHEDGRAVAWTAPGGRVMVQNLEPGEMTPQDARALSAALLAAANYAEQEKAND